MLISVLGNHPKLSLAELISVYGKAEPHTANTAVFAGEPWPHLGGSSKLARQLLAFTPPDSPDQVGRQLLERCLDAIPPGKSKYSLGISIYGRRYRRYRKFCFDLKKELRKRGDKVRLVMPELQSLSTAQVLHNKLTQGNHTELIISLAKNEILIGRTVWIQDISKYTLRDMGRPCRDMKVGMLPPKLAQIMINLGGGERIYDPFCGSGVILQEALLMGKEADGSDLSAKMVACTNRNLAWLAQEFGTPRLKVTPADATSDALSAAPGNIVSETYLGPVIGAVKPATQLEKLAVESDKLVRSVLLNWAGQLTSGCKICLAVPSWHTKGRDIRPSIVDEPHIDGYNRLSLKGIDQDDLTYRRDNQYVGRALILLERS